MTKQNDLSQTTPKNCVVDGGEHCLHWPYGDGPPVYCCHCDLEAWRAWKDEQDE